jgi:hypothetical protein
MPIVGGYARIFLPRPCFDGPTGSWWSSCKLHHSAGYADHRVLRGGGWNNNPANVRAANRNRNAPDNRNDNTGFRCVIAAASSSTPLLGALSLRVSTDARTRAKESRRIPVWMLSGVSRYRDSASKQIARVRAWPVTTLRPSCPALRSPEDMCEETCARAESACTYMVCVSSPWLPVYPPRYALCLYRPKLCPTTPRGTEPRWPEPSRPGTTGF